MTVKTYMQGVLPQFDEFMEYRGSLRSHGKARTAESLAPSTIYQYRGHLTDFSSFMTKCYGSRWRWCAIERRMIGSWIDTMRRQGLKENTIGQKVKLLERYLAFICPEDALSHSTVKDAREGVEFRVRKRPSELMSPEELEAALTPRGFWPERSVAILHLLCAGFKADEVRCLDREDVYLPWRRVRVRGTEKERVVQLDKPACEALKAYMETLAPEEQALFVGRYGGRLTRKAIWDIVREQTKGRSPEAVRYSGALHRLNAGADLREVSESLGHANLYVTDQYLSREREGD